MTTNSISSLYPRLSAASQSTCPHARTVLTDTTNNALRPSTGGVGFPQIPKKVVYPAPSARLNASSNGADFSHARIYALYSRPHPVPVSPFSLACKAPPTVSVSLSAASSRNCERSHDVTDLDLPDVRNVVPFPCSASGDEEDIEMLDGTRLPPAPDPSVSPDTTPVPAPLGRKRRSACSSVTSQSNSVRKNSTDGSPSGSARKRARKSKPHVANLSWLEAVHRSIVRGIEIRQSAAGSCYSVGSTSVSTSSSSFEELDQILAGRIKKRLVDGGCLVGLTGCREGRDILRPLPRISSPTMSMPALIPTPSVSFSSAPRKEGTTVTLLSDVMNLEHLCPPTPVSVQTPSALDVPVPPPILATHKSHVPSQNTYQSPSVHFVDPNPRSHPSTTLRRSPSPPPRTTAPSHSRTLTLTMPQLVACLTLSHRERSGIRARGRSWKAKAKPDLQNARNGVHSEAGRPASQELLHSSVCPGSVGSEHDGASRRLALDNAARLMCAPERKSPLSRVAYVES